MESIEIVIPKRKRMFYSRKNQNAECNLKIGKHIFEYIMWKTDKPAENWVGTDFATFLLLSISPICLSLYKCIKSTTPDVSVPRHLGRDCRRLPITSMWLKQKFHGLGLFSNGFTSIVLIGSLWCSMQHTLDRNRISATVIRLCNLSNDEGWQSNYTWMSLKTV